MTLHTDINKPLVSVVIPCYNQGIFLREAIESVLAQEYPTKEIIVVDDGSSDNTFEVAKKFEEVKYIHQYNQGLSAARNAGILHSSGEYLIFLDADDVLLENVISFQVDMLHQHPQAAFVSGAHFKSDADLISLRKESVEIKKDHYLHLLQGNYIGMHAAVMYRRKVFDELSFDTTLKVAEDYDLYLEIASKYPVVHHTKPIAIYRLHKANMSDKTPVMLSTVLEVLRRHCKQLKSGGEKQACRLGMRNWINYYSDEMYRKLKVVRKGVDKERKQMLAALWKYKPGLYIHYKLFK